MLQEQTVILQNLHFFHENWIQNLYEVFIYIYNKKIFYKNYEYIHHNHDCLSMQDFYEIQYFYKSRSVYELVCFGISKSEFISKRFNRFTLFLYGSLITWYYSRICMEKIIQIFLRRTFFFVHTGNFASIFFYGFNIYHTNGSNTYLHSCLLIVTESIQ